MPKTAGGSTYPQGKVREKSGKINAQFANADLSTNLFANLYIMHACARACIVCIICVYINMGRLVSWLASRQMEDGGETPRDRPAKRIHNTAGQNNFHFFIKIILRVRKKAVILHPNY